ncbi:MAG: winged helix-turn-helix domain-containing protein [Proteobacteria bacterium]|nr:winged helix-turn-helix domain-containing protein [Burkholderiales bacterium]
MLHGARVTLGARAFDLLTALIGRQGQLATKDELMAEVWAGTVVDENNLAAQISALRKMLSGDPALSGCLQTVPGRGYRFVPDIEFESEGRLRGNAPLHHGADAEALSLVVLPLANLSSDPEQAYFAQGLTATLATDLSRISGLQVISSATAATFAGRDIDVREVSRELSARYVLTGSVQRLDRRVRINAHLVDGQTGMQAWSELFDGDAADLLELQDQITGCLANAIGREIFVAAARDGEARRIDPRCCDLVMRGIAADNRPQSLESLREQEALFARAAEFDPKHGEAHARLARAILLQVTQGHAPSVLEEETLARGVRAAERAVALDPANARAHCAMGLLHVLRGDFERSVVANETAIALDRNFALAHNNLGNSLVHLGKGREALPATQTALRLDPRGPQIGAFWTTQGFARMLLGELDEAIACFSRGRAANPKLPRAQVGAAISLALSGDASAAQRAADDLLKLIPHYRLSKTMDGCLPNSPLQYRRFYEEVLCPGALLAGVPV